jgi:diguanylate cyclase (GGDEF)-like protein/PAS domain S-box-containing protein
LTLIRNHPAVPGVFAVIAIATAAALGLLGWPEPHRTFEFSGLVAAAILASIFPALIPSFVPSFLAVEEMNSDDLTVMPASFAVDFAALLLLGPDAATIVALAGTVMAVLVQSSTRRLARRLLVNAGVVVAATQTAGLVHRMLGGTLATPAGLVWPWQGIPIAAAVAAYCFVKLTTAEVVVPFATKAPVARSWLNDVLHGCPTYLVAASIAGAFVEIINQRAWAILPVAAVPLFFIYRAYSHHLSGFAGERRRTQLLDALNEGVAVLDDGGRVTDWSEGLERLLGCASKQAIGRTLSSAVPALAKTELPRAITDVVANGNTRILPQIRLSPAADSLILQVKIVPLTDGITLVWHDVTERVRAEQAVKRTGERLALAAEGANDGLWEWDLRTQEFYFSGRWNATIGLPPTAGVALPAHWFDRVHADDIAALKAAIEAHLSGRTDHLRHEHRVRHENGTYRLCLCRAVAVPNAGRRSTRIAGSLTDTTEHASAQERLQTAGYLDPLTGLRNRSVFVEGLGDRLEQLKLQQGGDRFAVLYLDLDRFKIVNDSLGHLVGDELLTAVSRRLESCLRPNDVLARLGGDEFAILLNGLRDGQQANVTAFRIQDALREPFAIGGREVFTSASIGIAVGRTQYTNPDEMMRDADTAMYHAKSRGKARHEMFDADMHARAQDRLGLENDLRHAVNNNDFEVHYQPIVSLASGMCVGFESLVRWTRNGEAISPATFVPIAEELGLIEPLGTWVMQQACTTFAEWQRRLPGSKIDCITVNVSSRQLMQQNFLHIVEQAVQSAKLKPCDLRLEITETALMDSPNVAAKVLSELRDFGVKIYLDDFSTGYSSLSHLHKLPVDALKIDRSFVRSLELPDRPAIVESILALARTLHTSVVAEGIESEVQASELKRLGCTHAQGYLFSRPLSMHAAEALLIANQPLGPGAVEWNLPIPAPQGSVAPPIPPARTSQLPAAPLGRETDEQAIIAAFS